MKKLTLILLIVSAVNLCAAEPSPTPAPNKLNEALAEMLQGVTNTASQAKEFVVAQLPDVVKQLLYWKMAESAVYCLMGVILITIAIKSIFLTSQSDNLKVESIPPPNEHYQTLSATVAKNGWFQFGFDIVKLVVCGIIGLSSTGMLNLIWLQILIAPKVYLIEYCKNLVGH